MNRDFRNWFMVLTHEPTGISIRLTDRIHRTQHKARKAGMKYIRSRLAMLGYAPELLKVEVLEDIEKT